MSVNKVRNNLNFGLKKEWSTLRGGYLFRKIFVSSKNRPYYPAHGVYLDAFLSHMVKIDESPIWGQGS